MSEAKKPTQVSGVAVTPGSYGFDGPRWQAGDEVTLPRPVFEELRKAGVVKAKPKPRGGAKAGG